VLHNAVASAAKRGEAFPFASPTMAASEACQTSNDQLPSCSGCCTLASLSTVEPRVERLRARRARHGGVPDAVASAAKRGEAFPLASPRMAARCTRDGQRAASKQLPGGLRSHRVRRGNAPRRGGIGGEARASLSPRLSNDGSKRSMRDDQRSATKLQWLLPLLSTVGPAAAPQGASSTPRRCFTTRWHQRRSEGKPLPSPLVSPSSNDGCEKHARRSTSSKQAAVAVALDCCSSRSSSTSKY
jgi:hypothetical protein